MAINWASLQRVNRHKNLFLRGISDEIWVKFPAFEQRKSSTPLLQGGHQGALDVLRQCRPGCQVVLTAEAGKVHSGPPCDLGFSFFFEVIILVVIPYVVIILLLIIPLLLLLLWFCFYINICLRLFTLLLFIDLPLTSDLFIILTDLLLIVFTDDNSLLFMIFRIFNSIVNVSSQADLRMQLSGLSISFSSSQKRI